jgi:AcrR family transcriptional regulator
MTVRTRRRGEELESAILTAAWDELVETGYARLTMGSVAARAHTSEPVLYRRWANKDALVLAALERHRRTHPVASTDTGSLRGDLLTDLAALTKALTGFYTVAIAAVAAGLSRDSGLAPAQMRAKVMGAQQLPAVRAVYQRAHDRGEIDLDRVPAAVLAMPFDLVRHDMLMGQAPVGPDRIRSIVDDLFLPLVH